MGWAAPLAGYINRMMACIILVFFSSFSYRMVRMRLAHDVWTKTSARGLLPSRLPYFAVYIHRQAGLWGPECQYLEIDAISPLRKDVEGSTVRGVRVSGERRLAIELR